MCARLQVRYVAAKPSTNIKAVIGNRVMDIFDDVFTTYMEAEYVLFIEEDLECSPDIFRYVLYISTNVSTLPFTSVKFEVYKSQALPKL